MANEEVIELSIQETNQLRLKLGLKPLQIKKSQTSPNTAPTSTVPTNNNNNDEISLSIDETNKLRANLGLDPLRATTSLLEPSGRKPSDAIHAPAMNTREQDEIKKRIEEAKLKKEVMSGIKKMKQNALLGRDNDNESSSDGNTLSWADKMRKGKINQESNGSGGKGHKHDYNGHDDDAKMEKYTDEDLKDQNLTVTHSSADFEEGTTTILTLADKSIADAELEGDEGHELENINMTESATIKDNLKRKRMVEMGMGHGGGYVGFDDDEFEEIGGSQLTLDSNRASNGDPDQTLKTFKGFKLGKSTAVGVRDRGDETDNLFATFQGKSTSLVSTQNTTSRQSDFMTHEEEESMVIGTLSKPEIEKRRKRKEKKLLKKIKKSKKSKKLKVDAESDSKNSSDEKSEELGTSINVINKGKSLLEDLEGSATHENIDKKKSNRRRRRQRIESDDSDDENDPKSAIDTSSTNALTSTLHKFDKTHLKEEDIIIQEERKRKFNTIMEKGNARTKKIFGERIHSDGGSISMNDDTNEDDAFLSAALSKARRLRRLRDLNAKSSVEKGTKNKATTALKATKGADAVVQAIRAMKKNAANDKEINTTIGITFEVDPTKEFTRSLRSQLTHTEEFVTEEANQRGNDTSSEVTAINHTDSHKEDDTIEIHDKKEEENDTVESLVDLATQITEDPHDVVGGFGDTASTVQLGRGLSNFLSMLKHTGDITGKNAGKEELRGRAKDERTYEDYEKLDLKNVVKIDTTGINGNVNEKDLEFASREIKLEYRDEHGRLLTRKEAYRNLCYQFHGHAQKTKNEEKKLKQIERERIEASLASRVQSLGALKKAQKATGKAFVIHKT